LGGARELTQEVTRANGRPAAPAAEMWQRRSHWGAAVLAALCCLQPQLAASAKDNQAKPDCEELGFSTLVLCSDCKLLGEYVRDERLVAECLSCCAKESDADTRYAKAVLEICKQRLPAYTHVNDFIKAAKKKYGKRVQVKYKFGAFPQIVMKTADGKTGESIRIDNWQAETIEEYLTSKLAGESQQQQQAEEAHADVL